MFSVIIFGRTRQEFVVLSEIRTHLRVSEIELKHCASSKTNVKSSRKYFVHLNWIRLALPNVVDSVLFSFGDIVNTLNAFSQL